MAARAGRRALPLAIALLAGGLVRSARADTMPPPESHREAAGPETPAPEPPAGIASRETPTGDWGGLRRRLAERGVTLDVVLTTDLVGIASGGVHRRAELLNNLDLVLSVETEPLLGWRGGRLLVYGLGLSNTGSPSENAGDRQVLDDIDAPGEWKLYEAWFEQTLLGGRLSLRAGLYDLNGGFDVIETAAPFLNSSFGIGHDVSQSGENGPIIFPTTSIAARLDARPWARS